MVILDQSKPMSLILKSLVEPSKLLLGSVISVFSWISKDITLYPSNNHTCMPSIDFLCVGSFYIFISLPYNRSPEK